MKQITDHCPDLETIAAYLDGRLGEPERARVSEHLADCEDCYVVFSESAQTHVAAAPREWGSTRGWRGWTTGPNLAWSSAGAALATAACLWLLVGPGRVLSPRPADELQALVAAVGTDRPIEGRLSGGFAYGPLRGPVRSVRSGASSARPLSPDVRIAAARSEKALAANRTAENLHAFGIASVIVGEIDRAITLLEQAADQPSPNAQTMSDLAAAYLARASRDNSHQDLMKALSAADRAVMTDPRLPEGLFNRAVALERLSLVGEARVAWEDYLRVDDQSGWADEARRHPHAPERPR
jgi:tetratricopeptide (TPR) repeat protein